MLEGVERPFPEVVDAVARPMGMCDEGLFRILPFRPIAGDEEQRKKREG